MVAGPALAVSPRGGRHAPFVTLSQPISALTGTQQGGRPLRSASMAPASNPPATPPRPVLGPPVYVVGGGPGGLAAAAALRGRGVRAVVLEKAPAVAASWRRRHDRLRLHTTRRMSGLPGLRMPRSFGRWVSRDDMVRYLETYAGAHGLEVVTGVEVLRVERAEREEDGWVLHASGGRRLTSRAVVVATGAAHRPVLPDWPGRETWSGDLTHAAAYRSAAPYEGRDVLVVGAGNTGAEIAVDLVEGGAARVRLAVRTAPHVVRRSVAGWPAQATGVLVRRLPVWPADRLLLAVRRATVPDLSAYGLPRPGTGPYARLRRDGAVPVHDTGLVDAVRRGRVEPVAAVAELLEGGEVALADGSVVRPDAVIAATGYRAGLEGLVGHLGVLDRRGRPRVRGARTAAGAPGLYFVGFHQPPSGLLRELAVEARRVARAIAAGGQPPAPYGVHGGHGPDEAPGAARRRGAAKTRRTPGPTTAPPAPARTAETPETPDTAQTQETQETTEATEATEASGTTEAAEAAGTAVSATPAAPAASHPGEPPRFLSPKALPPVSLPR
ncbi:putative oxidoreductase CzcO [Streptomyces rubrolavendulae]|uniref:Putative oxidoreductase CzcO n=1 Tax=Streptomyces rubrolavendulae TaxID=285473 RepID=A0A1D8G211_9ACTN|nr:putative oxidoreductase CzcO [Streptomyces rubrolavendulae]